MTITRDARLEVQTVGRKWMGSAWLTPDLFFPKTGQKWFTFLNLY